MTVSELQGLVARLYADHLERQGLDGSLESLNDRARRLHEDLAGTDLEMHARHLTDLLVDVVSVAIELGVDLEASLRYFVHGCPSCGANPCDCN